MVERKGLPDRGLQRPEPSWGHPRVCVRQVVQGLCVAFSLSRASVLAVGSKGSGTCRRYARHASVPHKGTTFLSWYLCTFPGPCCLGIELPWSSSWEDGGVVSAGGEEWRPRDGPGCAPVQEGRLRPQPRPPGAFSVPISTAWCECGASSKGQSWGWGRGLD